MTAIVYFISCWYSLCNYSSLFSRTASVYEWNKLLICLPYVDVDRVYKRRPKTSMPASCNHLQYTNLLKLLIQHFTPTSGSLQLCSEVINNILIVPEFIQSRFKCVSGVNRNNPVRQTIPDIDHSERQNCTFIRDRTNRLPLFRDWIVTALICTSRNRTEPNLAVNL